MPKLAATPWKLHTLAWHDCKKCELHRVRTRIVLARGKLPCDVLFVGEAPGASEDVVGTPFCGPAGSLLDAQIKDALEMAERTDKVRIAFTNLVACIPRCADEDDPDYMQKIGEPTKDHIAACRPRLSSFIKNVARPKKVVAVGGLAAKHLTDFNVQITHPAAILRASIEQRGLMIQRVVVTLIELFEEV